MPESKNFTSPTSAQPVVEIALEDIKTPDERAARFSPDDTEIRALADNIQACGLINPIIVTGSEGEYLLVAGGRRCAAVDMLGWPTIPARIRTADTKPQWLISLSENLLRQGMSALEEAHTLAGWLSQDDVTEEHVAQSLGHTVTWVRSRLDLLNMPEDVQDAVHVGSIPIGAARPLSEIDDTDHRTHLLTSAHEHGVTVNVARSWRATYAALKSSCDGPLPPPVAVAHYADPPRPTQVCFCCGEREDMRNITLVPMHPGCFAGLSDAVHRSTDAPPEDTHPQ